MGDNKTIKPLLSTFLHTIRQFGNLAAHELEEADNLTIEKVLPCLISLYEVADWYCTQYNPTRDDDVEEAQAVIFTESETAWKHLKKAKEKLNVTLDIVFNEDKQAAQTKELLAMLDMGQRYSQEWPDTQPHIFLFDRNNPDIIKEVTDTQKGYKKWGNNFFSFVLPIPDHRRSYDEKDICIEFYYTDDEICRKTSKEKRLFLTTEFDENGRLQRDKNIRLGDEHWIKIITEAKNAQIIDSGVRKGNKRGEFALSRATFAHNVYEDVQNFNNFDFRAFKKIFDVIETILQSLPKPEPIEHQEAETIIIEPISRPEGMRSGKVIQWKIVLAISAVILAISTSFAVWYHVDRTRPTIMQTEVGIRKVVLKDASGTPVSLVKGAYPLKPGQKVTIMVDTGNLPGDDLKITYLAYRGQIGLDATYIAPNAPRSRDIVTIRVVENNTGEIIYQEYIKITITDKE